MKKVLVILALLSAMHTFAQEEFLGTTPGISGSYIHTNRPNTDNTNSFKFNASFNDGISISIIGNAYKTDFYPTFGLNFLPGKKEKDTHLLGLFGLSFSKAEDFSIAGFSGGIMQCIHSHSHFPLSLQGKIAYQTYYFNDETSTIERRTILGLGYHQAFYAKSDIYPYLGFSSNIDILNIDRTRKSNIIYTLTIGFNINLGD
ncbi:MAG: hypothetical protein PF444_01980 [Bacteroidales bacterium]|nr:hypothetical protein [Bacteroidales bacterium]